ncbi:MAG: diguanylate cyclase [Omnitrophica bacterium RIFCSPLOWO2_12_FULL_44_17]|uniref:Diguanylate cyclase n=1 Tax=Candidatus Danuiimicrobium aquiferis TaxID=1801832 RepID=A0A1G1KYX2_9BACT|nr:MAG: diguanylate cyclase [Omnitrophica bacterium RIFCSPHIGHO2_02_FULL_45_28]OGW92141.1 MAG: diguanylate cyclase [Omnitrophica bacterium RIFCSPHIGHO2_12_FULL_44_12]OGW98081.1 MAG: diguanylate cyclase [Omnitrophica bacterium RIFCSPLOWO2_12_FULL_44_17]OGX03477.1 MAG: diguanylate cyclase [Omnitrophica bacterium RIFCSPLOWO2_02_FULL_44_11]
MKICIPTETNEGKRAEVYGHFGSAPYFTIVDTEKNSVEIINNANQHHSHGMCQPMSALVGKKIDAVVTGGMGARAVQKLNAGGIKAYKVIPGTVADIVSQFTKGGLDEITVNNACAQHSCH